MKGLYKTTLFKDCDQNFVHNIASHASLDILPENALITNADIKSSWIHIILRGYCILQSHMAGDKERGTVTVLKPGDACPVVETLNRVLVLVDVKAVTAVELISIKLTNLEESLDRFPDLKDEFTIALSEHRKQNESLLLRRRGRLPEMVPFKKSMGQGDLFKYNIYDVTKVAREIQDFKKNFAHLGKLLALLYFRDIDYTNKKYNCTVTTFNHLQYKSITRKK